jgi:hypothetical protein
VIRLALCRGRNPQSTYIPRAPQCLSPCPNWDSFDSSENIWLDHAVFRIRDILERIEI